MSRAAPRADNGVPPVSYNCAIIRHGRRARSYQPAEFFAAVRRRPFGGQRFRRASGFHEARPHDGDERKRRRFLPTFPLRTGEAVALRAFEGECAAEGRRVAQRRRSAAAGVRPQSIKMTGFRPSYLCFLCPYAPEAISSSNSAFRLRK